MTIEANTDTLLTRVVDRTDRPEDWDQLDRLSLESPAVVAALWDSLRGDCTLRAAVEACLGAAGQVGLPTEPSADAVEVGMAPAVDRREMSAWRQPLWLGWLAACVVAALWMLTASFGADVAQTSARVPAAGIAVKDGDVDGLANESLETTAAAWEGAPTLPDLVLDAQPAADGDGYELVVVRRVLDRVRVPELYGVGRDEYGQPTTTRVTPALLTPAARY